MKGLPGLIKFEGRSQSKRGNHCIGRIDTTKKRLLRLSPIPPDALGKVP